MLAADEVAQLANDIVEFHGPEAEVLATRPNGLGDVFGLRCSKHEDDVIGRLFQRLQERIGFVEDVDFEAVPRGTVPGALAKFTNFVDAAIGGGVDFDYIDRVSSADFGTGFANSAGLGHRVIFRAAVQGRGQDAGDCSLADAPVAAEDVAMGGASLLDRVLQGPGDVLLADDLGELLWTVFAGQDSVGHERESLIIRDAGNQSPHGHKGAAETLKEGKTGVLRAAGGILSLTKFSILNADLQEPLFLFS